jgi:hypothetical protein
MQSNNITFIKDSQNQKSKMLISDQTQKDLGLNKDLLGSAKKNKRYEFRNLQNQYEYEFVNDNGLPTQS